MAKLMPNLDQHTTKLLNLTVLQRTDPSVDEILMTATHVTFYQFNVDQQQWGRKDVEGSLFVVKRNSQPRFQFIVMNRLNTNNMVENLLGDFEYDVQVPYLMYRNSSQEVFGIWFYNTHECEELGNLFGRILNAYPKIPAKPKVSQSGSESEDMEVVTKRATMGDPLGPPYTTSSDAPDVSDDQSFMSLFHNAMKLGSTPNTSIHGQTYNSSAAVPVCPQIINLPTLPSAQAPATVSTTTTILPMLEKIESNNGIRRSADLVTPSSLIMPPVSSSIPSAPLMNHQGNPQSWGAPLLQPFLPPQSVTPTSAGAGGPIISRNNVREALQMLVQDDQFIDMVYQAVVKSHHS